jgi:hypothetical protein
MKTALTTSIVWLALAMLPASARSPDGYENTHEIEPQLLTLPSLAGGTLAFQRCSECKRFSYTLDAAARFYIKNQEVGYGELKRHIETHPNAVVLVVTSVKDNVVTRLTAQ